jgi:hypothetical protein
MTSQTRLIFVTMVSLCLTLSGGCSDSGSNTGGGSDIEGSTTTPSFEGDSGSATSDATIGQWNTDTPGSGPNEPTACESNTECPPATPFCSVSGQCFECLTDGDCEGEAVCTNGLCLSQSCTPGQKLCNGDKLLTCNADGTDWDVYECPGEAGWCEAGACIGCEPGYAACSGKSERVICAEDGSVLLSETCPTDTFCVEGACLACYPGTKQCLGDWVQACNTAGGWENEEDCAASGSACSGGICQSPCDQGGKLSNEGCDYWAIDMDNIGAAADSPYAVIVSNLNDFPVEIDITSRSSADAEAISVASGTVPGEDLAIFELPQQNMGATGIFWKALRVQSSGPIVAYQFNPLENVAVYSNDASLLLPSNTYGMEYVVVSREQVLADPDGFRGSISVVATSPDTQVTITPTTKCLGGSGVLALNAGQTATITLEPYQVFNIRSDLAPEMDFLGNKLSPGGDLTGTIITSNKPIGVFAGHDAAVGAEQCCADHLEQQLFPVSTWGKTYVATKSFARGLEKDYWRIIAATDGTQVSVSPTIPGVPATISLSRGGFYEFKTEQDVVITSTEPVMVAQTLASSFEAQGPPDCTSNSQCLTGHTCEATSMGNLCILPNQCETNFDCIMGQTCYGAFPGIFPGTCECNSNSQCPSGYNCVDLYCQQIGDPALILSVPVEQFREQYVFLTPTNYLDDYINIVAQAGTQVTLDNTVMGAGYFTPVGDGTYQVARLKVGDGVHSLDASAPVGVVVYGYDDDVSYGYPGGLSLSNL